MKLNLQNRFHNFINTKILIFFALAIIFVDEVSKVIAQKYLDVSCNPGIAFGFGEKGEGKIASFVALTLVFFLLWKAKEHKLKLGFFLVFAGGLANLVDRMFWGCVRDFIAITVFPSFNISDVVISLGLVVIIYVIFDSSKSRPKESDERNF